MVRFTKLWQINGKRFHILHYQQNARKKSLYVSIVQHYCALIRIKEPF